MKKKQTTSFFSRMKQHKVLASVLSLILIVSSVFIINSINNNKDPLMEIFGWQANLFKADFLSEGWVNKYTWPITDDMNACISSLSKKGSTVIATYSWDLFDWNLQTLDQIKAELMPVFWHAVQHNQINWKWSNPSYTFIANDKTDAALWTCYLQNETKFFKNFLSQVSLKQDASVCDQTEIACSNWTKQLDYFDDNWCAIFECATKCPYDCQSWNSLSNSCIGPEMNGCQSEEDFWSNVNMNIFNDYVWDNYDYDKTDSPDELKTLIENAWFFADIKGYTTDENADNLTIDPLVKALSILWKDNIVKESNLPVYQNYLENAKNKNWDIFKTPEDLESIIKSANSFVKIEEAFEGGGMSAGVDELTADDLSDALSFMDDEEDDEYFFEKDYIEDYKSYMWMMKDDIDFEFEDLKDVVESANNFNVIKDVVVSNWDIMAISDEVLESSLSFMDDKEWDDNFFEDYNVDYYKNYLTKYSQDSDYVFNDIEDLEEVIESTNNFIEIKEEMENDCNNSSNILKEELKSTFMYKGDELDTFFYDDNHKEYQEVLNQTYEYLDNDDLDDVKDFEQIIESWNAWKEFKDNRTVSLFKQSVVAIDEIKTLVSNATQWSLEYIVWQWSPHMQISDMISITENYLEDLATPEDDDETQCTSDYNPVCGAVFNEDWAPFKTDFENECKLDLAWVVKLNDWVCVEDICLQEWERTNYDEDIDRGYRYNCCNGLTYVADPVVDANDNGTGASWLDWVCVNETNCAAEWEAYHPNNKPCCEWLVSVWSDLVNDNWEQNGSGGTCETCLQNDLPDCAWFTITDKVDDSNYCSGYKIIDYSCGTPESTCAAEWVNLMFGEQPEVCCEWLYLQKPLDANVVPNSLLWTCVTQCEVWYETDNKGDCQAISSEPCMAQDQLACQSYETLVEVSNIANDAMCWGREISWECIPECTQDSDCTAWANEIATCSDIGQCLTATVEVTPCTQSVIWHKIDADWSCVFQPFKTFMASVSSDKADLKWTMVDDMVVDKYVLTLKTIDWTVIENEDSLNLPWLIVTWLTPSTTYKVELTAYKGDYSKLITEEQITTTSWEDPDDSNDIYNTYN